MILLSFILPFVCTRSLRVGKTRVISSGDLYLIIMAIIFTIIMGLRSQSVGIDTSLYVKNFLRIGGYQDLITALSKESNSIPVYAILCRLIFRIYSNAQFHIFVEALLINISLFIYIKKTSVNYIMSVFLYYGLTLMYFGMNGTRQTLSIVLCANAIDILNRNIKNYKGWILFVLAVGIHVVGLISIVMIAGMFISKRKNIKIITGVFAGMGAVIGPIFFVLSNAIANYFPHYKIYFDGRAVYGLNSEEGGGRIIIVYLFLSVFILAWFVYKGHKDTALRSIYFSRLIPGIAFGIFLGIFNASNILINRVVWYFVIFFISFIPYVIGRCPRYTREILSKSTVIAFLTYSFLFLRENHGAIVPYHFFWM